MKNETATQNSGSKMKSMALALPRRLDRLLDLALGRSDADQPAHDVGGDVGGDNVHVLHRRRLGRRDARLGLFALLGEVPLESVALGRELLFQLAAAGLDDRMRLLLGLGERLFVSRD